MTPEARLLDRPHLPSSPPPLDWLTLADAFEVACLVRCTPTPTAATHRPAPPPHRAVVEFNREDAALRMRQLLIRLDVPVDHEVATGGLRRRYQLHRLHVPTAQALRYAALREAGWRQGRRELLGPAVRFLHPPGRLADPARLGGLALGVAGRRPARPPAHPRHPAGRSGTGRRAGPVGRRYSRCRRCCAPVPVAWLVSVADGPDRLRIMERAALGPRPVAHPRRSAADVDRRPH